MVVAVVEQSRLDSLNKTFGVSLMAHTAKETALFRCGSQSRSEGSG